MEILGGLLGLAHICRLQQTDIVEGAVVRILEQQTELLA
jgi:hypothetical protein